jgi:hypothetical protein
MELPIRPEYQRFHDDPASLLGTRWYGSLSVVDWALQHVEVIDVAGDRVHIATPYAVNFRHWKIPVASLLIEQGAFTLLGVAGDFSWVRRGQYVATSVHGPGFNGVWQIEYMDSDRVYMFLRNGMGMNCDWPDLLTQFHLATEEERHVFFEEERQAAVARESLDEMLVDDPKPVLLDVVSVEDPLARATAWERLIANDK